MTQTTATGRLNQKRRTRKDLLEAAFRLLEKGEKPTLEEVADEALVSRATAYRYFQNVEALLNEAALDVAVPEANELFGDQTPRDPLTRLERLEDALQRMLVENEAALRLLLANAIAQRIGADPDADAPMRQDRRTPLIEAALAPAREQFAPSDFERLKAALALILGAEAMVVFRDALQLGEDEARQVKRWMIGALVAAAKRAP